MTIYIAGPISGKADLNRPIFEFAACLIRALTGAETIIPHDLYTAKPGACPCLTWCEAMLACLPALEGADAVCFLPGWKDSAGARREHMAAIQARKLVIYEN